MLKTEETFFAEQLNQYKCPEPFYYEMGDFIARTALLPEELKQAAALRYQCFYQEVGKKNAKGDFDWLDVDNTSSHLMFFERSTADLVAVCRLNSGDKWYSETEFDIRDFLRQSHNPLEIGRVCIAPKYRVHRVFSMLLHGVFAFMRQFSFRFLFGCVSNYGINQQQAHRLWLYLRDKHSSDGIWRVSPVIEPWNGENFPDSMPSTKEARKLISNVLRLYLNSGSTVAGLPFYDAEFNCYDFLTIQDYECLNEYWRRDISILNGVGPAIDFCKAEK